MNFESDQDLIDALTLSLALLADIIDGEVSFDVENTSVQVRFARTLVNAAIKHSNVKEETPEPPASFCYIDHATGESDHMNAHIKTKRCE